MQLIVRPPDESFTPVSLDFLPHISMRDAAAVVAEALGFEPKNWLLLSRVCFLNIPDPDARLDIAFGDGEEVELYRYEERQPTIPPWNAPLIEQILGASPFGEIFP